MQIQIDPNIPSNVPDEELRDFQSFIQTALDGLTDAAGGEVMALGTGLLTGLALIVVVIAGVKIPLAEISNRGSWCGLSSGYGFRG